MSLSTALPEPECYFDPGTGKFLIWDHYGDLICINETQLKRNLKKHGFCDDTARDEMLSDIETLLDKVIRHKNVAYVGSLAGYKAGLHIIEGRRILVTDSPKFIEPKEGPWPTLREFLLNLLGEEQMMFFMCWLKVGIAALRERRRRPGQALVVAGPASCGKSLLQNLITKLLGNRSAKPYQYFCGLTQFNGELFQAEHLMVEDEAASPNIIVRRTFGRLLNGCVVNETQRCHPKNRQGLTLTPWWRVSITLNDEAENLMVLPPMDESLLEKFMIFRAKKAAMPMPTQTTDQREAFMGVLEKELHGFVHYLLHELQIPTDDRCDRFGVKHYHNRELMEMMSALSPEMKLMELIDAEMWSASSVQDPVEMKASELEVKLAGTASSVAHEARKLFYYTTACGQYLGRLWRLFPDRVTYRIVMGTKLWRIEPPKKREEV